jgi:hypothetical protein
MPFKNQSLCTLEQISLAIDSYRGLLYQLPLRVEYWDVEIEMQLY